MPHEAPLRIPISQNITGFDRFFCTWVFPGPPTVIVDTGPAYTGGRLVAGLENAGIRNVDLVLITHIHIDHAGGLAAVFDHYPEARAVCHASGIRHLTDPAKLWMGSLQVLGELAEVYGPPPPIAAERLLPHDGPLPEGLIAVETPGHAPHHLSFVWDGHLLVGEAGGNMFRVGQRDYLRPATPPRFMLPVALESVDRLLALDDMPIRYAHTESADSSHVMLRRFRDQLLRWEKILAARGDLSEGEALERAVDALLQQDPELAAFPSMTTGEQSRERNFIGNSIRGFRGWLQEAAQ